MSDLVENPEDRFGMLRPFNPLFALKTITFLYFSCHFQMIKDPPGLSHVMELKVQRSSLMTTVDWSPNMENIETRICLTGSLDGKITVSTLIS